MASEHGTYNLLQSPSSLCATARFAWKALIPRKLNGVRSALVSSAEESTPGLKGVFWYCTTLMAAGGPRLSKLCATACAVQGRACAHLENIVDGFGAQDEGKKAVEAAEGDEYLVSHVVVEG